jgi:hypothetical protein
MVEPVKQHAPLSEAELARVVAGVASPDERAAIMARVRDDAAAQKTFRTLVEAERALAGSALDVPSASELDALLPSVLPPETERAPAARRAWIPGALAAAAVVAFAFLPRAVGGDEFHARGGPAAAGVSDQLFCVEAGKPPRLMTTHDVRDSYCAAGAAVVVVFPAGFHGHGSIALYDPAGAAIAEAGPADVGGDGVFPGSLDIPASAARGLGTYGGGFEIESETGTMHYVPQRFVIITEPGAPKPREVPSQ